MSCRTKENRSSQGCQQPRQAELPPHSGACHSCCPESVVSRHGRVRGWGARAKGASGDLCREWEAQQKQERPQQRGEGRTADGCPGGRGRDAALAGRCPGIRLLGSSRGPVKTRTSQKWLLSWSFTPLRFLFFLLLYSLFLLSFFACAEAEETVLPHVSEHLSPAESGLLSRQVEGILLFLFLWRPTNSIGRLQASLQL